MTSIISNQHQQCTIRMRHQWKRINSRLLHHQHRYLHHQDRKTYSASSRSFHSSCCVSAKSTSAYSDIQTTSPLPNDSDSPTDWEAKYNALKAERQAAAIQRWEELQDQFPDLVFESPDGTTRPGKRVVRLVNKLFNLTMMESFQLAHLLDKTYGFSSGINNTGGSATTAASTHGAEPPASSAAASPTTATPAVEKTTFTVRLDSFPAADKIKVIKEVRTATGLGLKESKDLVESCPKIVKKDLSKADCDALVSKLQGAGAKVTIE